jgi:hypothetical protein
LHHNSHVEGVKELRSEGVKGVKTTLYYHITSNGKGENN